MNRTNYFNIITGMLLVLVLSSCEDIIDVKLRSAEPRLVIEGNVRMGAFAEVLITQTKDFTSPNDYLPVTDAVVTIQDDAGNSEILLPDKSGRYVATAITGVEQRTYRLTVTYDGVDYTAVSYMPPVVELDSLTLFDFPVIDYPEPMAHFTDPLGEENQYYRYVVSINDERPRLGEMLLSTEFMDGQEIHEVLFVHYDDHRDEDPIQQGDLIFVEMRCLDKGAYTFFDTWDRMGQSLANPTSNITGGALGYFSAYSYSSGGIVAEW